MLIYVLLFFAIPVVVPWIWPRWLVALAVTIGLGVIAAFAQVGEEGLASAISWGTVSFVVVLARKYLRLKKTAGADQRDAQSRVWEARVSGAKAMREACIRSAQLAGADVVVSTHLGSIDPEVVN